MSEPTVDQLAEYERVERDGGVGRLTRDVVEVTGPEAGRYLQGQLSQEVVALADGSSTWSLVLQPTGKVDAWFRLLRRSDEHYVLDIDAGWGEALAARLRRFLLRTKATVADPQPLPFVAWRAPASTVVLGDVDDAVGDAVRAGGAAAGPGVAGSDLCLEPDAGPVRTLASPEPGPMSPATLERYRIAHAVPAMGAELTPDTIPAEAGRWLVEASVSFSKGCYTGQELVARIDSRGGNVPRPIRLLAVETGATPVVGGEVRCDGTTVGAVTSATPFLAHHQPALALGPVARSVAVGAAVEVETEAGLAPGTVVEPPFPDHGAR
jgi:folate-binding protein YgfZ